MEPFRFERFARSRMCSPNDDISKKEKKTELGNQIKRLENSKMKWNSLASVYSSDRIRWVGKMLKELKFPRSGA